MIPSPQYYLANWIYPNSFKELLEFRNDLIDRLNDNNQSDIERDITIENISDSDKSLKEIIKRRQSSFGSNFELTDEMKTFKPFEYKPQNGNHLQKAKKNIGKGGRPTDPKIAVKKRQLCLDYYSLTEKKGFNKKKAIKELEKKYPNWKKSTIEKYIK